MTRQLKEEGSEKTREKHKKALIITSIWGFAAKFESDDIHILQKLGYEVHYASNKANPIYLFPENIYEQMGVIYHDIPIWQSPFGIRQNAQSVKAVRKIIKKENIQIVHCHTPTGGMVARLASAGTKARVIYTVHGFHFYKGAGFWRNLFYRNIENFLGWFTDDIVTINHEDLEAAKKIRHAGTTSLIPGSGLDLDYFFLPDDEQKRKAKAVLGYKSSDFLIVQVGELRENKNQAVMLRALDLLKETGMNIHYLMVGAGKQGNELREMADNMDLGCSVRFSGYQKDVRLYFTAADITAFPSIREGMGMAALESIAMGVPVLASDNRGTREYMQPGVNGYVCYSNSPEEYAMIIKKMIQERKKWSGNSETRKRIRVTALPFEITKKHQIMEKIYMNSDRSG